MVDKDRLMKFFIAFVFNYTINNVIIRLTTCFESYLIILIFEMQYSLLKSDYMKPKTLLFTLSFFLLVISSCNNTPMSSSNSEKLYIKTTTAIGVGENQWSTEAVSEVTSDYFEVILSSLTDHVFEGEKILEKPTSKENFKYVFFVISDKDGNQIKFKESTEFLNYMSAHGYKLVDQVKNDYGADYTFKRK